MDGSRSTEVKPRGTPSRNRMADNPHPVPHPAQSQGRRRKFRPSIYFGILQYILWTEYERLTLEQQQWITHYASRLDESQLIRAGKFATSLLEDSDRQVFHSRDILQVRRSIPWIELPPPTEISRIGKGYRDKGSLRPLHRRGVPPGDIPMWDEDVYYLLPFDHEPEGRWITAEEVESLTGIPFGLLASQVNQGRISPEGQLYSLDNPHSGRI